MDEFRVPCDWAPLDDALYRAYHDEEWGVPIYDGRQLWAKLQLDGMQAGLAWITILRKRDTIIEEFDNFDPRKIARWDEDRIEKALQNSGIIRSKQKIKAVIGNAQAYLKQAQVGEDFGEWCWSFVGGKPIESTHTHWRDMETKSELSEAFSKALKQRGHKFVGPTIVQAWMQAVGLINAHEVACMRHAEVKAMAR